HPLVLACAIGACLPTVSFALGIRIADQDARATARGNAFTATADNPSAIYYNPAGISQLYSPGLNSPAFTPSLGSGKGTVPAQEESTGDGGGLRLRMGVYAITLGNEVNLSGGRGSLDISHRWQVAGSFYATWKKEGSPLTFGLGMYSPYGFGVWYSEASPLRQLAISGSIAYTTLNPVVSWQVSDTLSIAVGPTINYAKVGLKRGIVTVGDGFEFEGTGWAVGANAGIMWRPSPKHSFGLMYRSETQVNFDGHSNTFIPTVISSREAATANITFPQNVVLGYSYRPTPKWNFEVDVDWTDWDRLNTVTLNKSSGNVSLPFNWQSSFFYEFGATYQFDSGFTASAGYIYSENSVPNNSFNPLVPDSNRHIVSVGVGKQYKNWSFDLAYQYAFGPTRTVTQGSAADGTYKFNSNAISISAGYRF
ncbi:MAG: outer membrane protein transport protein, partial [Chthoniobacteraceae bacterium]